MSESTSSPMTAREVLDTYFLETRAKLLEIAATLDRVDRSSDGVSVGNDARVAFIQESLKILQSTEPHRARRIQVLYSK